jgi:hypothetical protein
MKPENHANDAATTVDNPELNLEMLETRLEMQSMGNGSWCTYTKTF